MEISGTTFILVTALLFCQQEVSSRAVSAPNGCNYDDAFASYAQCDAETGKLTVSVPLLPKQPANCAPVKTQVVPCPPAAPRCRYNAGLKIRCDPEVRSRILLRIRLPGSERLCPLISPTVVACTQSKTTKLTGSKPTTIRSKCDYFPWKFGPCDKKTNFKNATAIVKPGSPTHCEKVLHDRVNCDVGVNKSKKSRKSSRSSTNNRLCKYTVTYLCNPVIAIKKLSGTLKTGSSSTCPTEFRTEIPCQPSNRGLMVEGMNCEYEAGRWQPCDTELGKHAIELTSRAGFSQICGKKIKISKSCHE